MLEVKNLVKVYKPKKGVPVTAINNVSLTFPDKGMVFLLGKSGSGKSTLLHLLSGLDRYDGGEIIIKGVSSKAFRQQHFDSYRNTYVGFIFQDYNVLDDFTVGANIALAIELQGRKATDAEINNILKEVDLEGYGNRKPNELSGGQKQRVAIARALVKAPEIIMADEPTGALDSNTGKQVFDTLKRLSSDKLVIIVSHDREFAENYADRIIELADGEVISDMEIDNSVDASKEQGLEFDGDVINVPHGYHLTEQDRELINDYLSNLSSAATIKKAEKQGNRRFKNTDTSAIRLEKGQKFKLIKSKLPLKNAFKIGGSSLKHKKVRLVFTIILSCIAFTLFGLADTFGAYNHVKTCTNSLIDSEIKFASVKKTIKSGSGLDEYWIDWNTKLSEADLEKLKNKLGYEFVGVYKSMLDGDLYFNEQLDQSVKLTESDYNVYATRFSGYAEITSELLDRMGYKILAGTLPNGEKDEIAISEYCFKTFEKAGYREITISEEKGSSTGEIVSIKSYDDIIGKTICLSGKNYIVTAVIDTGFNLDRYIGITENTDKQEFSEQAVNWFLFAELDIDANYSLHAAAMVGKGGVKRLTDREVQVTSCNSHGFWLADDNNDDDYVQCSPEYVTTLDKVDPSYITWVGEPKQSLAENEIIVTKDITYQFIDMSSNYFENSVEEDMVFSEKPDEWDEDEALLKAFADSSYTLNIYSSEGDRKIAGCKIAGYIDTDKQLDKTIVATAVIGDSLFDAYFGKVEGIYNYALAPMPEDRAGVRELTEYCYDKSGDVRYAIQSAVTHELDSVDSILSVFADIFLYVGLGFALFAALMLSNFIATSISHKKREIGILRAIGSRSNDVFRIFFAESFIIAMINFVLSCAGTYGITVLINSIIRSDVGILITILNFGVRQVALLLLVSIAVAAIASFIPVRRIASKRPIDAIRDR